MFKYKCKQCGKIYEPTKEWRSKLVCCPECRRLRKNANSIIYWQKHKIKLQEERRLMEIRRERMKPKYTIEQLNDMAREQHLTYGQMQGLLYVKDHPLIQR